MISLDEARARVGDRVAYCWPGGVPEPGVITSVSPVYVFVRYDGSRSSDGIATSPTDLTFEPFPPERSRISRGLRRFGRDAGAGLREFHRALLNVFYGIRELVEALGVVVLALLIILPFPVAAAALLIWAVKS